MKKKIVALSICIALLVAAIVGGTLAYFTDTDAQKNTFTTGDVLIDLWEDFGDNDGIEELIPATGSAQNGTLENGVEKEVYVTNTGTMDAYVRVHIAIPAILDNGDPTFDASQNVLHFNYSANNVGPDKWDWSTNTGEPYTGNWNFYTIMIDDIEYNVYVVTYEKALAPEEVTVSAIHQVYLDSRVSSNDLAGIREVLGNEWYIYVAAEGTQADGFDNAYEALNTAFGNPTDPAYTTTIDWYTVTGQEWVNLD